jgi:hypothetical protein
LSDTNGTDIEELLGAVDEYGATDPEEALESLADLLRVAWNLMTEGQRSTLLASDEAQALLAAEDEDEDE